MLELFVSPASRFIQPIFPDEENVPASQPGYAPLHRGDENSSNGYSKLHGTGASGTGLYSKLDRGSTRSSCDSSPPVEYSKLEHGAFAKDFDVSFHSLLFLFPEICFTVPCCFDAWP